ncbi:MULTISPECIES: hypothetical protein [Burkholderia]|uniref:hypothetical protein n=1 Tax=Burkholderia TaxID=32008 RepID=UPI000551B144|nr:MULTISPECIES: hypothetical protein [Burkholderia]TCT28588.1 hypothetical protein EC918_10854 [Burkholderia vietnamiensis]SCZ33129.1 hypothetical protein SAMN02787148_11054 [Burkholderia vietnamiensis]SFX93272.1 hypothetical protein SAMN02787160_11055 [Burkholderia vietnamiensis]
MTKRTPWPMRIDAGTTTVGTARVRDDSRRAMATAQREIFDATGNRPPVDAGFDDISEGVDASPVMTPSYRSKKAADNPKARMQALGRLKAGAMNQTEKRYADHLESRKRTGEVAWFRFEGIKFRLADNTFYTPDFAVMLADGQLEAHEVKGHWQDDARAKIKIAADQYPVRFIAVMAKPKKAGGGWQVEEF